MNSAEPPVDTGAVKTLYRPPGHPVLGWVVVLVTAIVGLAIVKWIPYYHKGTLAAANHSIGSSILMGNAEAPPAPSVRAALDYAVAYANSIWKAMVLGLLLGSAVQVLLPRQWITSALGQKGMRSVVVGSILSVPTMMCTCCAAPVVAGLRACRAAPGSAVAFWLGNTVLNPATLVFTGFVLGWHWTALRLVMGLFMVVGLGWLVGRLAAPDESIEVKPLPAAPSTEAAHEHYFIRWMIELGRMCVRLLPEYVVLVLLLGAARAWLFPLAGHHIDNSLLWILGFALAGAVFVIPTAGEVPIVQAMLGLGVGVGPSAALLMTLPPISAPSVAMLWGSFRAKTFRIVTAGVVLLGCVTGIVAAWLFR